ncbi:hypothetical protein [Paucibacter sp. M5-1]|uniref:hypothetical protein n=1 Tax=Paucibacter sp. M5-1 TaxID=3015998 RepID=UPI0022B8B101|nr:hypothetical protein [Paucibacter sp. M5-1]MCZ7880553.1 hypothetical protein [Paucibacter sp. M5-1]
MKNLTVIALSLLAAGAALADGGSSADTGREAVIAARKTIKVTAPQTSREEVLTDLLRAIQTGELRDLDRRGYRPMRTEGSTRSREEVVAELLKAIQAGELRDMDRRGYRPKRPEGFTRSRAEVAAELARARATGELDVVNGERSDYAHQALVKQQSAELVAGQPTPAQ